jgi:hypothetical protein
MSGEKYDVMPQNGDCSREAMCVRIFRIVETKFVIKMQRHYRTQYGKYVPSDNAIRH